RMIEQYGWPGNVRELRNVIERATILSSGAFIEPKHLPPTLRGKRPPAAFTERNHPPPTLGEEPPAPQQPQMALAAGITVEEAERRLIMMTLEHTRDNKKRAAEIRGVSLTTLHHNMNNRQ